MATIHQPTVILKPEMLQLAPTVRIDSFCKIEGGKGVKLGEFVHIASFSHLNVGGGTLIFEDHSTCSSGCHIGSASPDWTYLYISAAEPSEHHHVRYYVTRICAFAMLGMGVVVLPGRTVSEGAIVRPGSLVDDDVKPWTIVAGNPAKRVGTRTVSQRKVFANLGIKETV